MTARFDIGTGTAPSATAGLTLASLLHTGINAISADADLAFEPPENSEVMQ